MKRVIILGSGLSGKAVEALYLKRGIQPIVLQNDEPFDFHDDDEVICSPGIPRDHPWVLSAKNVIQEVEVGLRSLKGKVLGITGSNGKTTTTLLVSHVTGAIACGNIGKPICSVLEGDLHVVELSSFQLDSMQGGPYLDAAVILNITPNHLDWHATFEDYVAAKMRIRDCLKKRAPFWRDLFPERVETILGVGYRDKKIMTAAHEMQNVAAALLLCQSVGVSKEEFFEKLQSFKKPPHRIEYITTIEGVDYINDSKATSVDAVKSALATQAKPVHLIAGGVDKGGSFEKLRMYKALRSVFAFGEAKKRIEEELKDFCPVKVVSDLEEALVQAKAVAKSGECVLLSPGCSSYDQFENFQERGERFRELLLREGKR